MTQINPPYLVPTVLSLLAVLYPAPWHIRTRNIATLSMIFWMTALNIAHLVNCEWRGIGTRHMDSDCADDGWGARD
jgi:hypothetical protein